MSFLFFTSLLLHYIFNIQIASRHCDSYRYVLCICDANDASTKRGMNATLVCGTCFWAKKTTTKQHITKCKAISQCSFQSLNIDKQRRWYGRGALRLLFSFVTFFFVCLNLSNILQNIHRVLEIGTFVLEWNQLGSTQHSVYGIQFACSPSLLLIFLFVLTKHS